MLQIKMFFDKEKVFLFPQQIRGYSVEYLNRKEKTVFKINNFKTASEKLKDAWINSKNHLTIKISFLYHRKSHISIERIAL